LRDKSARQCWLTNLALKTGKNHPHLKEIERSPSSVAGDIEEIVPNLTHA
jgi:hypothetical protein